jgi:hypothetical protein
MCRPGFRVGASAPKVVRASFRRLSRNRQEEKRRPTPNVPIFPDMRSGGINDQAAQRQIFLPLFPE